MNILVLGGAGFLGSHVADQLTMAGHHVRIFDRMSSPWLHQDQQMILGDLLDQETLDQADFEKILNPIDLRLKFDLVSL